jgi:hypothetical protein
MRWRASATMHLARTPEPGTIAPLPVRRQRRAKGLDTLAGGTLSVCTDTNDESIRLDLSRELAPAYALVNSYLIFLFFIQIFYVIRIENWSIDPNTPGAALARRPDRVASSPDCRRR